MPDKELRDIQEVVNISYPQVFYPSSICCCVQVLRDSAACRAEEACAGADVWLHSGTGICSSWFRGHQAARSHSTVLSSAGTTECPLAVAGHSAGFH